MSIVLLLSASDSASFQTILEQVDLDKHLTLFQDHGVDNMKAFCLLTQSDFEKFGLNKGQSRKCAFATEHLNRHKFNWFINTENIYFLKFEIKYKHSDFI